MEFWSGDEDRLRGAGGKYCTAGGVVEKCVQSNFTPRNRSAFAITETELKLIANPAIIGLSSSPKNG